MRFLGFADIKEYRVQREYKMLLKKTILTLKLMKNLINKITDNQYLSILISKFVEINEKFNIFKKDSIMEIIPISNTVYNKKNSLYLYTLQFVYYFLSIAYRLAKKSQRLKDYIYSLLNLNNIRKAIIEIPLPFDKEKIEELKSQRIEKSTKLVPKLKYYYKLKRVGIEIYYYLGQNILFQMNNIGKNVKELYEILRVDLAFTNSFQLGKDNPSKYRSKKIKKPKNEDKYNRLNEEESTIKDGFELIVASYRKTIYKYFFQGIFPILYSLKSLYKTTQEFANSSKIFFSVDRSFASYINNYVLLEKDKDIFKKIIKLIRKNE